MEIIKMEKLEKNLFLLTFPKSEKSNLINNYNINENSFEYDNNNINIRVNSIESFFKEKKKFKFKNKFYKNSIPIEEISLQEEKEPVIKEDEINYKQKYREYLKKVIDKDIQNKFELEQWEDIQSLLGDMANKYINKDLLRDLTSQNLKVDYYSEDHIQKLQSIYSQRNGNIENWEKMIILHPAYDNKTFNFLNIIMKILDCKELSKEEKKVSLLENPFFFKTLSEKAKKITNEKQEEKKAGDLDSFEELGEEDFV